MAKSSEPPAASSLSDDEISLHMARRVILGDVQIPPYPSVAMRLRALVVEGNYRLSELAILAKQDQALVSALLRISNSPFYRRGAEVNTVERAVTLLGGEESARIALAVGMSAMFAANGPLSFFRRDVWRQALTAAMCANHLAYLRGLNSDHGFMAGLLHDIGRSVAISCLEDIVHSDGGTLSLSREQWMPLIEQHHIVLGVKVAENWNLPSMLVSAIRWHHDPACASESRDLVEVVQACDQIVALMDDCPYLLARDLEALPAIRSAEEAWAMMECVPLVPAFIASLEAPQQAAPQGQSVVAPAPSVLTGTRHQVSAPAQWVDASGETPVRVTTVAEDGLGVNSPRALPEGGVLRLILGGGPAELEISGRVVGAIAVGGGYYAGEIKLFALPGQGRQAWLDWCDAVCPDDASSP